MKENENIEFYRTHRIAPAINEHKDQKKFLEKRRKLYRQLGIPLMCIEGKDIVEFGASCGENSLPLITGFDTSKRGAHHIDIVEPNVVGRDAIQNLFKENGVSMKKYTLYSDTLETFSIEKKYDIIIAEQFLQHCRNWRECLSALDRFAKSNSIIIITCADSIGLYVEMMKRFVGRQMVNDIEIFNSKVEKLVELFGEHLNLLKGMNKTHKDYVADMFYDDFILNGAQMNMVDAIDFLKKDYDVLGASQNIFTDHSWYKDIEFDYIDEYMKQYQQKKHMFMFAGDINETTRSPEENEILEKVIEEAIMFEVECEREKKQLDITKWKAVVDNVSKAADNRKMEQFNIEFLEIINKLQYKEKINLSEYAIFAGSFGKSSQYLSFVHK